MGATPAPPASTARPTRARPLAPARLATGPPPGRRRRAPSAPAASSAATPRCRPWPAHRGTMPPPARRPAPSVPQAPSAPTPPQRRPRALRARIAAQGPRAARPALPASPAPQGRPLRPPAPPAPTRWAALWRARRVPRAPLASARTASPCPGEFRGWCLPSVCLSRSITPMRGPSASVLPRVCAHPSCCITAAPPIEPRAAAMRPPGPSVCHPHLVAPSPRHSPSVPSSLSRATSRVSPVQPLRLLLRRRQRGVHDLPGGLRVQQPECGARGLRHWVLLCGRQRDLHPLPRRLRLQQRICSAHSVVSGVPVMNIDALNRQPATNGLCSWVGTPPLSGLLHSAGTALTR